MEVLSDILNSLHVTGSVYFCDHVNPPWTKTFADPSTSSFHMVRRGHCWAEVAGESHYLGPGDLIFIGPNIEHQLSSESPERQSPIEKSNTLLLCGYCSFEESTLTPLKQVFPLFAIVRAEEFQSHPWLKSTFDQLSAEYMSQKPGTEIIVNKLTEVVLIELVRINFGRQSDNAFLKALNDARISKALKIIHSSFDLPLTIESLASKIGMSRSAFSKRFTEMIGLSVFSYLSKVRVQKAKERLKNSRLTAGDVAYQVGYESERAFTKTFKKFTQMTPKQYQKESIKQMRESEV